MRHSPYGSILVVYITSHNLLLKYVRKLAVHSGASSPKIWVVMVVIQIITFAFLVSILIEIILRSAYASLFLKSTVILTYGSAICMFGLLASKLLCGLDTSAIK